MTWFPEADMPNALVYPSPQGGSLRPSPSPSPQPSENLHTDADANLDTFQEAQCASWHSSVPQGLGLITLPVTRDNSYVTTSTLDPFTNHHRRISLGWPSELSSSAPPTCQLGHLRKDSWSDQSCDPRSTLLSGAVWDHLLPASLSTDGYQTSPGRSEYTHSSHPSAVSSPYPHSEIYIHPVDSPQIKIESDQTIPQIHFPANDLNEDLFADDDQAMKDDELSIEERIRTRLPSYSSSENGDHKIRSSQMAFRRPQPFGDLSTGNTSARTRRKRVRARFGNADFYCELCGKPFQRAFNLRSHMLNVHNPNRKKPHVCDYEGCTNKFLRPTDLTRHVRSVHQRLRDFKCELCGKDFPRKDTLMRHEEDGCAKREKVRTRNVRGHSTISRL